jgi:transcriptional regulator GlxA family with amidase domain
MVKNAVLVLARLGLYLLAFALPPLVVGAYATSAAISSRYVQQPSPALAELPTPPTHDPDKPTAVVLLGASGAQVTDVLAPYEVLSATGAFNVYAVAPERRLVPLSAGLGVIPHLSLAELDQRLTGEAPAVIVVPAMPGVGGSAHQPIANWLRAHAGNNTTLLSICNGADVLAEARLLDGRRATANWMVLDMWERKYPATQWIRGQRYVEDGNIVTAAGVTSGIDGTLHVIGKLLGVDVATATATAIGYPHAELTTSLEIPSSQFEVSDLIFPLNAAYAWDRPTIGVVIGEGVGEIQVAAVLDAYTGQSFAANTVTVSSERGTVRSAHGLDLVARSDLDHAPALDRVIALGNTAVDPATGAWAEARGLHLEPLPMDGAERFAFDAALSDLAKRMNAPSAQFAAKSLEWPTAPAYPGDALRLSGPGWPWALALRPVALGLLSLSLAAGLDRGLVARRRQANSGPVDSARKDVGPTSGIVLPSAR